MNKAGILFLPVLLFSLTGQSAPEADEKFPIMWKTQYDMLEAGIPAPSFNGKYCLRRDSDGGPMYVRVDKPSNALLDFSGQLGTTARGDGKLFSNLQDIVFAFDFRPNSNRFSLVVTMRGPKEILRYRGDVMKELKLVFSEHSVKLAAIYDEELAASGKSGAHQLTTEQQMALERREEEKLAMREEDQTQKKSGETESDGSSFIADDGQPFPRIQPVSRELPPKTFVDGKWYSFRIVADRYDLIVYVDGKEFLKQKINPGAGSLQMSLVMGKADFRNLSIREIRPSYETYLDKNLIRGGN